MPPAAGTADPGQRGAAPARGNARLAVLAVAGMALWFRGTGAFWTFAESAAAARKIPGETIGIALAWATPPACWDRSWPPGRGSGGAALADHDWHGLLCLSVLAYGYCSGGVALAAGALRIQYLLELLDGV